MSQAERILYIDRHLRSGKKSVTASEVADYFEVSVRQVKRDIEYLRDRMNAPIVYDSVLRGYVYQEDFKDLEFANQDMIISYLALLSLAQNKQYMPLYKDSLLDAIDQMLPSDYKSVCKKISYQMPPADAIRPEYFESLCTAMRDSKCLDIQYRDVKGNESQRRTEPMHLINYGGSWYMVAYDIQKEALRTFNISRITSMSLCKEKFSRHNAEFRKTLEDFLSGGFGIFHGTKTQNVAIRFYGNAARIVSTQSWHEKQKITPFSPDPKKHTDEGILLEFPAADFTEVLSKILSFGSLARPEKPGALVELWKNEIKNMYGTIK